MHDHKGRPLITVTLESVEQREAEIKRLRDEVDDLAARLAEAMEWLRGAEDGFRNNGVDCTALSEWLRGVRAADPTTEEPK